MFLNEFSFEPFQLVLHTSVSSLILQIQLSGIVFPVWNLINHFHYKSKGRDSLCLNISHALISLIQCSSSVITKQKCANKNKAHNWKINVEKVKMSLFHFLIIRNISWKRIKWTENHWTIFLLCFTLSFDFYAKTIFKMMSRCNEMKSSISVLYFVLMTKLFRENNIFYLEKD